MEKFNKSSIITTFIAILLLVYVGSLVDFSVFFSYFRIYLRELLLLIVFYYFLQVLRISRYYFVFRSLGFTDISFFRFLPQGMVAATISTYGPLKSGELLAMQIYYDHFDIKHGNSLAVIIVSRAFDVMLVIILSSFALFIFSAAQISQLLILMVIIIGIVAIIILIALDRKLAYYVLGLLKKVRFGLIQRIIAKLEVFLENYFDSLPLIWGKRKARYYLIGFTLLRWISELFIGLYFYHIFGIDLQIYQIAAVIGLSQAIGVASGTPGSLGTGQITALSLLVLMGVNASFAATVILLGLSVSIIVNFTQFLVGLVIDAFTAIPVSQQLEI